MENPQVGRAASRRRRGVTLIEAVLYISIALTLIVGGLVFYQQTVSASRVNSAARSLSFLIAEMRQVVRDPGVGIMSTSQAETLLLARGSVPMNSIDMSKPAGQRIRSPWGGNFAVGLTSSNGRALVVVYLYNIPVVACTRLGVADASGSNFWTTGIELGLSYDDGRSVGVGRLGPDTTPDEAGISCSGSDLDDDGLVRMIFNLRVAD